jgi:hypothetical protein
MTSLYKYGMAVILLLPFAAGAQQRWRALLPVAPRDSFYSIPINPELTDYSRVDLGDLRIMEAGAKTVPYLIDTVYTPFSKMDIPASISSIRSDTTKTVAIIKCYEPTSFIRLMFMGTSSTRTASLTGSRDSLHWFSIADEIAIAPFSYGKKPVFAYANLNFSLTDYPFLRLEIQNGKHKPLNLIMAEQTDGHMYLPVQSKEWALKFQKQDTQKLSRIIIKNRGYRLTGKLHFYVRTPRYFSRAVQVYNGTEIIGEGKLEPGITELEIRPSNDSAWRIVIENGDSPALEFDSICGSQRSMYLVAWLEKGKKYMLEGGNLLLTPPAFDLAGFRQSLSKKLPELIPGPALSVPETKVIIPEKKGNWIWIALAAGIGLLTLLSISLLRDLKRKQEQARH